MDANISNEETGIDLPMPTSAMGAKVEQTGMGPK